MLREVHKLRLTEERHPNEQDVWQAYSHANENNCIVELEWFIPHYGMKKWIITPDDSIHLLLQNLHISAS